MSPHIHNFQAGLFVPPSPGFRGSPWICAGNWTVFTICVRDQWDAVGIEMYWTIVSCQAGAYSVPSIQDSSLIEDDVCNVTLSFIVAGLRNRAEWKAPRKLYATPAETPTF